VREIEAAGDAEALELVRLYPDDIGFEVWCGSRLIGQVGRDKIVVVNSERHETSSRQASA
jgi:hypothetical protein